MNPNDPLYERYNRQIILKGFGEEGQQKLLAAKVLVIGAGGLGCPVLQYLTAAGVGTIGIIDDDVVALSNLHRQVLYTVKDIGSSKAERAVDVLKQLNPEINFIIYNERLSTQNALTILSQFDIIIDGTDNFPTRYLINDACVLLDKPLVFGAISQFEGQVTLFNCHGKNGEQPVNYRDLFPQPPLDGEIQNCAEAGVLGVLPGIIGTMMANETIKLIAGIGEPLINRLFIYNALNNHTHELMLSARQDTRSLIPKDAESFSAMEYGTECFVSTEKLEITSDELIQLSKKENIDVIDIRETDEQPILSWLPHRRIPLSLHLSTLIFEEDTVVIVCQTGKRSLQFAQKLINQKIKNKKIYSLKGGVLQWQQHQQLEKQA